MNGWLSIKSCLISSFSSIFLHIQNECNKKKEIEDTCLDLFLWNYVAEEWKLKGHRRTLCQRLYSLKGSLGEKNMHTRTRSNGSGIKEHVWGERQQKGQTEMKKGSYRELWWNYSFFPSSFFSSGLLHFYCTHTEGIGKRTSDDTAKTGVFPHIPSNIHWSHLRSYSTTVIIFDFARKEQRRQCFTSLAVVEKKSFILTTDRIAYRSEGGNANFEIPLSLMTGQHAFG